LYGEPKWEDKYKMWDKLRKPNGNIDIPWIVIGDFKEILYSHEKEGGKSRPQGYMQSFWDALTDRDLDDLGFSRDPFTWTIFMFLYLYDAQFSRTLEGHIYKGF
jgi:hypothetical protein